jgi:hypothetical protein
MQINKNKILNRLAIFFISFLVIFQSLGLVLFLPKEAKAQDAPAIIAADEARAARQKILEEALRQKDNLLKKIWDALVLNVTISARNIAVKMAQSMGERVSEAMITGDWGEEPMFDTMTTDYFYSQITDYTIGTTLDLIREDLGSFTEQFDICAPSLDFGLILKLNIQSKATYIERTPPNCEFSKVKANWEAFQQDLDAKFSALNNNSGETISLAVLDMFAGSFNPQQNEVGGFIKTIDTADLLIESQREFLIDKRDEEAGYKESTNLTREVKRNPDGTTELVYKRNLENEMDQPQDVYDSSLAIVADAPMAVMQAFLSSFASRQFLESFMKKLREGLVDKAGSFDIKNKIVDYNKDYQRYSSLITRNFFTVSAQEVDILSDFSTCDEGFRNINNCVMTTDFADAVRQSTTDKTLTVAQAVNDGAIDADWHFIANNDKANEPLCFENNLCYPNLVKMRKARIIPIGWELASLVATGDDTFGDVLAGFDECADATGACPADNKYQCRFCHLVDPNWVLKYPKTRCNATGYGSLLVGNGSTERSEYCADQTSCLKTDNEGTCLAFGYCAAEKNIWRFGGTECPGQFDSCSTFIGPDNKEVSYLVNTVDRGGCDASNAGCKWYSASMAYTVSTGLSSAWIINPAEQIYFNKNLADLECDPDTDGCTELINSKKGGVNLMPNGDFELPKVANGSLNDIPGINNNQNVDISTDTINNSKQSLSFNGTVETEYIPIVPQNFERYFGVNLWVKINNADVFNIGLRSTPEITGNTMVDGTQCYNDSPELYAGMGDNYACPLNLFLKDSNQSTLVAGSWQNIRVIAKVPANTNNLEFRITGSGLMDNLMISELSGEEYRKMEVYSFSNYGAEGLEYLKVAPEYFGCYADKTGDTNYSPLTYADFREVEALKPAVCDNYAQICAADEVGCQPYFPKNGGSTVYGVTSFEDACPGECVGYDTFSRQQSSFKLGNFPEYIVPSLATKCVKAQVSCEEFTNLDTLKTGGEGKEYFTALRKCVKPDAVDAAETEKKCANFYTWVGSGVSGYQLQAYTLEKTGGAVGASVEPKAAIPGYTFEGKLCNETTYDPVGLPNCRQFYNEEGATFYAFYENTITCSDDCHPYRRTEQYTASGNLTAAINCQLFGGEWNGADGANGLNGECIFYAIPSQGVKCSAQAVGCKEYRGNNAAETAIVFNENFDANITGWSGDFSNPTESMYNNGKSLKVNGTATKVIGSFNGDEDYLVTVWAKGPGQFDMALLDSNDNVVAKTAVDGQRTGVGADFAVFSTKFSYVGDARSFSKLSINTSCLSTTCSDYEIYFDKIEIKTVNDTLYLIDKSINVPVSCDTTNQSQYLPQAQLGCREYTDATKATKYLKSFSSTCRSTAVGCESFINTHNSISPFEGKFDNNLTVGADNLIYLIKNKEVTCNQSAKGCTMLGSPTLNKAISNNTVTEWSNQSFKILPDEMASQNVMCGSADLGCEEYISKEKNSTPVYFREPGDRVCEWKQIPDAQTGGMIEGWYQKGTLTPCDTKDYYQDGVKQLLKYSDPDYFTGVGTDSNDEKWVGLCDRGYDKCTAFIDPVGVFGSQGVGKAYYYKNINLETCNFVSKDEGCLLFSDTSDIDSSTGKVKNTFNAFSTYSKNEIENKAVEPNTGDLCWKYEVSNTTQAARLATGRKSNAPSAPSLSGAGIANIYFPGIGGTSASFDNLPDDVVDELNQSPLAGVDFNVTCTCYTTGCNPDTADDNVTKLDYLDSNKIVKVVLDRECAEWYDCEAGYWTYAPTQNKYVYVCQQLGLCDTLDPNGGFDKCGAKFIREEREGEPLTVNEVIDLKKYQERPISWSAFDYSGYSIPNLFPLQFYQSFDVNPPLTAGENPNFDVERYKLVRYFKPATDCLTDQDCVNDSQSRTAKLPPGSINNYKQQCLASDLCVDWVVGEVNLKECRIYPKADAPFPEVVKTHVGTKSTFENVNSCATGDNFSDTYDCGCNYIKKTYGGKRLTKYFPTDAASLPNYCEDKPNTSCVCDTCHDNPAECTDTAKSCTSVDCGEGMCLKPDDLTSDENEIQPINQYIGMEGFCLEYDTSTVKSMDRSDRQYPCYTWYPLDQMAGLQNIYNDYPKAGFDAKGLYPSGGPYYCSSSDRWESRKPYLKKQTGYMDCDDDELNPVVVVPKSLYPTLETPYFKQALINMHEEDGGNYKKILCNDDNEPQGGDDAAYTNIYTMDINGTKTDVTSQYPNKCIDGSKFIVLDNGGFYGHVNVFILTDDSPIAAYKALKNKAEDRCTGIDTSGVTKFLTPTCADGYEAKNLYKIKNEGDYLYWNDGYVDKYSFWYECVPDNYIDTTDVGEKWYYDPLGGIDSFESLEDSDTMYYTEKDNQDCTSMFDVTTGTNGKNKAFTDRIYQDSLIGETCNDGTPLKKDLICGDYGALAIKDLDISVDSKSLFNAFLKGDEKTECTESGGYSYGGTTCFSTVEKLNKLFVAVYGKMDHVTITPETAFCRGRVDELLEINCTRDSLCQNFSFTDSCKPYELRRCNNEEKYCYSDFGCHPDTGVVITSPMAGRGDECKDGEAYCFKYCTLPVTDAQRAEFINTYGCDVGGSDLPEKQDAKFFQFDNRQQGQTQPVMTGGCFQFYYTFPSENYTSPLTRNEYSCNAEVSKPEGSDISTVPIISREGVDNEARCYYPAYPSSSDNVKYQAPDNFSPIDKSFDLVNHPPIVAARALTGSMIGDKNSYVPQVNNISLSSNANYIPNLKNPNARDLIVDSGDSVFAYFYAWADDNQMPITEVTMLWGNNTYSEGRDSNKGKFKNHKSNCLDKGESGLCEIDGVAIPGFTCDDDADCGTGLAGACNKEDFDAGFGDSLDACDEAYFTYINSAGYECEADGGVLPECGITFPLLGNNYENAESENKYKFVPIGGCWDPVALGTNQGACIYVPRVQVLDNWGWCNADTGSSCDLPAPDDYKIPTKEQLQNALINLVKGTDFNTIFDNDTLESDEWVFYSGLDGCYAELPDGYGGIIDQCEMGNNENIADGMYPWTAFKGRVIVKP